MAALRALLFAVFGGFIGAAPAAPAVPDRTGHDAGPGAVSHSQKSEEPPQGVAAPSASDPAAAPPCTDTPGPAPAVPIAGDAPRAQGLPAAAPRLASGGAPPPPVEDVRAGLLDLPPPTR